jgi:hypothetical protein
MTLTIFNVESRRLMRPSGKPLNKNWAGKCRWISVFENGSRISVGRGSSPTCDGIEQSRWPCHAADCNRQSDNLSSTRCPNLPADHPARHRGR